MIPHKVNKQAIEKCSNITRVTFDDASNLEVFDAIDANIDYFDYDSKSRLFGENMRPINYK